MEVNARVAFVVWVLEMFANSCIIVVWSVVYGKTTFGTLTTSMIWYYLILPHTHLMNTSHNKHLIVEYGWKNTIRNAIGVQKSNTSIENTIKGVSEVPSSLTKTDEQQGISCISMQASC